jgi:hypothetical protein
MKKPLGPRVRRCSLAKLLIAVAFASILPLPAAAQCFGPYASFPAAQAACRNFLTTGFCSTNPDEGAFVEIIGYTTPDGFPAVACCCLALVALEEEPTDEAQKPEQDDVSEE